MASCSAARVTLSSGMAIRRTTQRATQNPTRAIPARTATQHQPHVDHSPASDLDGGTQIQAPANTNAEDGPERVRVQPGDLIAIGNAHGMLVGVTALR